MENTEDFYLVLPSNSSMKYFDNTTTKFTTQLEREIKLQGSWSVGISEIHIPQSIVHFQGEETTYDFIIDSSDSTSLRGKTTSFFNWGLYENVNELATEINEFNSVGEHQKFIKPKRNSGYWSFQRTCHCAEPHRTYYHRKIFQVFGFDESNTDNLSRIYIETNNRDSIIDAIHPACLSRALTNPIFIYSDICTSYNVGDTKTSLLRIVSINTSNYKFGNTVVQSFAPIHYFPLISNSFQNISIDIRDQFGGAVAFEFGTLTIKFHFKRDQ